MSLRFNGVIPITIHPAFWIFAALIGYINSASLVGTLIWVAIILVSVLFHELGHALMALKFKQNPRIELVALGGLTYHDAKGGLSLWKQFLIVFFGPLFGFILVLVTTLLLTVPTLSQGAIGSILSLTRLVNLFWTVVNLLPVLPLDGGQLMRIILEKFFGAKAIKYAMGISLVIALSLSLFFFLTHAFLIGALFFLFAFQSYTLFRKMRHFSESDRDESLRETLLEIESSLQKGDKSRALELCEQLHSKAKKGVIAETVTQYLALLRAEEGKWEEVYQLLSPIKADLSGDMLCLLHSAAFSKKDFPLVAKLGGNCFQVLPSVETALRNAYAHAQLHEAAPTLGWLQTARDEGLDNLQEVLADPLLDPVREDPSFQDFLHNI